MCSSDLNLSADLVRDFVLSAKFGHQPNAAHGEGRLRRARSIRQARMENAAVVRGLVRRDDAFLLENGNGHTGRRAKAGEGCGEPHQAAANYADLLGLHAALSVIARRGFASAPIVPASHVRLA